MQRRHGMHSIFARARTRVQQQDANGETIGIPVGGLPSTLLGIAGSPSRTIVVSLVARFRGLLLQLPSQRGSQASAVQPSREARLKAVAFKLEAILDELDEIAAQRIAIDVCMALERVRLALAAGDTKMPTEPPEDD